jgi:Protein of unknown function (DUF4241)
MEIPTYLERVFEKGNRAIEIYEDENSEIQQISIDFTIKNLGLLKVTTGKIIGCDPFDANDDKYVKPFIGVFPKGKFLCQLSIGKINENDERVAFARLKFSELQPIRWETAVAEGEQIDTYEGYGVDSGTGGFMDADAQVEYKSRIDNNQDYWEIIEKKLFETFVSSWGALVWDYGNTNIAFFSSGFGDGAYYTYIGYDMDNNICRLVTDFGIVDTTAKFI